MVAALAWSMVIVVGAAFAIMIVGAVIAVGLCSFLLADAFVRRTRSAIVGAPG